MSNTSNNGSRALFQELQDTLAFLKVSRNEYNKNLLLYNAVEESFADDNSEIPPLLMQKISDITLNNRCKEMLSINKHDCSTITTNLFLGLSDSNVSLDYEEAGVLRDFIESHLVKKMKVINSIISSFGNNDNKSMMNNDTLKLNKAYEMLTELFYKVNAKQESCVGILMKIEETLESFCNYKINDVPEKAKQKVEEFEIHTEVNNLKAQILHEKTNMQIISETKHSTNAYKELLRSIKKQQEQLLFENNQLSDLKENYKLVSSKQYEGILKSYLQYKKNIEKKWMIFNMCSAGANAK